MNVVASCGWLEYFADGPNAGFFATAIQRTRRLILPSICLLEVFKRVYQQVGEGPALQAAAIMEQGSVVELDATIALTAARLGIEHKLPLAASVVLATARHHAAQVWTQDADFVGLDGVHFTPRL